MIEDFAKKFPQNCRLAIWGSGYTGMMVKEYIEKNRPDINIVLWVDSFKTGELDGIKIISPTQIKENLSKFDLLFLSTTKFLHKHEIILKFIDCPYIAVDKELEIHCKKVQTKPEMLEAAELFTFEEDKAVYNMVCNYHLDGDIYPIQNYVKKKFGLSMTQPWFDYERQYMDFINKDAIEVVVDGGFFDGLEALVFKKHFKNLKKIYAFEPIYEKTKDSILDYYIKNEIPEIELIPYGLWDKVQTLTFELSPDFSGSHITNLESWHSNNKTTITTTTLQKFKKEYNVDKIDYIKFDIEGAELDVLKSSEEIILKDRPQMAISIYHRGGQDIIDIPLYLKSLLKNQNYIFRLDHYKPKQQETLLYAIPKELYQG